MLHLIGVSHLAQAYMDGVEKTDAQKAFLAFLKQVIQDVHPIFIAEEQSEENLAEQLIISIPKEIADSEGIEHRFCDPNNAERRSIGYLRGDEIMEWHKGHFGSNLSYEECRLKAYAIEMAHHFTKREKFWLRGLTGCREQNAVFICGDSHIESFTTLLQDENIPHRVAGRTIGMTEAERELARKIVEYLDVHPELRSLDFCLQ
jgi:hypothetical protein